MIGDSDRKTGTPDERITTHTADDERTIVAGAGALRQVRVQRRARAPIDVVWRVLTSSDEIGRWWSPGEVQAREGGRIKLSFGDEPCDADDGPGVDGVVKVCVAPYVFEFTWHRDYPEAGIVRFDLVELSPDETLITLVQNVPAQDIVGATAGWHEIVERLVHVAGTGAPPNDGGTESRFELLKAIVRRAGVA